MTDKQRILEITHKWLSADHGLQPQSKWGPDMQFLIEYIEDMELPVSTNKRKIEALIEALEGERYLYKSIQAENRTLRENYRLMKEKYEPEPEYDPYDEYQEEIDYDQLVDAFIRRLK